MKALVARAMDDGAFGMSTGLYYAPQSYQVLLDYCGFDGIGAVVESGRDHINHVLMASPRALEQEENRGFLPTQRVRK